MTKEQFELLLDAWAEKVKLAFDSGGAVNTAKMIVDIDRLVADAFDHETMLNRE